MYRTHNCGELRLSHTGNEVTLAGWVQTVRKFGSITFIDLRDRYGVSQLFFSETMNAVLDEKPLGREFVIQVKGRVVERTSKNPKMPTGDVEIEVTSLEI
jgi:aspartyl-tRNA synthetase